MIRINLLSVKRKKKILPIPSILIPGIVITAITLIVLGAFTVYLNGRVSDLKADKAVKEEALRQLQAKLKEVANYERDNELFREKNRIIEQLRKNQSVPLRLLDEVSELLPRGVWLTSLTDKGGTINIQGFAFTNPDIVRYVQNLKGSKYIREVSLLESRQTKVEDISVYRFQMTFKMKV